MAKFDEIEELGWYFWEGESLLGAKSNWQDMVQKMALLGVTRDVDIHGSYDHEEMIDRLWCVQRLRKIRARILKCSPTTQRTLQALYCEDARIADNDQLEKFLTLAHERLTPIARAYFAYRKKGGNPRLFWLLPIAQKLNTPPERLWRLAKREYLSHKPTRNTKGDK